MAGEFLQLAYMGEISIVFNLAYAELKSMRYFEKSQRIISELRSELEYQDHVGKSSVDLFQRLMDIDCPNQRKRQNAWGDDEHNGPIVRFLSGPLYSFFSKQWDKNISMWAIFLTAVILVGATIFDHIHFTSEQYGFANYIWWGLFLILLICLVFPPVVIYLERFMRGRLERVVDDIRKQFNDHFRPNILELIKQAQEQVNR